MDKYTSFNKSMETLAHSSGAECMEEEATTEEWVNQLKRGQLINELEKYHLDSTGKVLLLKNRLIKYLTREQQTAPLRGVPEKRPSEDTMVNQTQFASPNPFLVQPTSASTAQSVSSRVVQSQVPSSQPMYYEALQQPYYPAMRAMPNIDLRQWHLRFNGMGDPVTFLEKLETVSITQNINKDMLLPYLPTILDGIADEWYRNNVQLWRNWAEFEADFKNCFYPRNYLDHLETQILNKKQGRTETAMQYLTSIQTLIRRHGELTEAQKIRYIGKGLHPEYQQFVDPTNYRTMAELARKIMQVEYLVDNLRQCRLEDIQSQRGWTPRTIEKSEPVQEPPCWRAAPPARKVTWIPDQTSGKARQKHENVGRNWSTVVCFNCGQNGHYRTTCTNRKKMFCSRCGKNGVMSRDCKCERPLN